VLDYEEPPDRVQRPYLTGAEDLAATRDLFDDASRALSAPLSQILTPLTLDPLTVADDKTFLARLLTQPNLPDFVKAGLPRLY
jgi:hypothetical protein